MIEEDKEGVLPSRVHCPECRRIIKEVQTGGDPQNKAIEILEFHARQHEIRHTTHETTIIIYRSNLS